MKSKQLRRISLFILLLFLFPKGDINTSSVLANNKSTESNVSNTQTKSSEDFLYAKPEDTKWFRDAKYGWLIHWGICCMKGNDYRNTEVGWSRGESVYGRKGAIPVEVYDNCYKEFNPVKFDAKEWVEIAKAGGVKYITLLQKHVDGFCFWDSKLTDYDVMSTPFGRDISKELADACHEAGIRYGVYISTVDVYVDSFRHEFFDAPEAARRDWKCPENLLEPYNKFISFVHGQVRELVTNYGKVDIFWFDHGGNPKIFQSEKMFEIIRRAQPGILINNRGGLPGDFHTLEQRVGRFENKRMWEGYTSVNKGQNSWTPKSNPRSLEELVYILTQTVGGDGNLSLGPAPTPTGEIDPLQTERIKELGQWLKKYGESIYGTRGGPFHPKPWGASTYKDNKIYLHIVDWTENTIVLPSIKKKITASSVLGGGKVSVLQLGDSIHISVPTSDRNEMDTIVVLELDGPSAEAQPDNTYVSGSLAVGKKVSASSYRDKDIEGTKPENAIDDNYSTTWIHAWGDRNNPWLEIDLEKPETFSKVVITESSFNSTDGFELQYKDGPEWRTFYKGTKIGRKLKVDFAPITARFVRLNILKVNHAVEIQEFQIFAPEKDTDTGLVY